MNVMIQVEQVVADLGIQVGNLCQFLPQEKVTDFARMTPQELLDNTQKAVRIPDIIFMPDFHIRCQRDCWLTA